MTRIIVTFFKTVHAEMVDEVFVVPVDVSCWLVTVVHKTKLFGIDITMLRKMSILQMVLSPKFSTSATKN